MPPPRRERLLLSPVRCESLYLNCASSTCSFPSLVDALFANISSISTVLSITFTFNASSKLWFCAGDSSSSHTTVSAFVLKTRFLTSSILPLPIYVPGWTFSLFCTTLATVTALAVCPSSSSSSSDCIVSSPSDVATATSISLSSFLQFQMYYFPIPASFYCFSPFVSFFASCIVLIRVFINSSSFSISLSPGYFSRYKTAAFFAFLYFPVRS